MKELYQHLGRIVQQLELSAPFAHKSDWENGMLNAFLAHFVLCWSEFLVGDIEIMKNIFFAYVFHEQYNLLLAEKLSIEVTSLTNFKIFFVIWRVSEML